MNDVINSNNSDFRGSVSSAAYSPQVRPLEFYTRAPRTESNAPRMEFIDRGFHRTYIFLMLKEFDVWFMILEWKPISH